MEGGGPSQRGFTPDSKKLTQTKHERKSRASDATPRGLQGEWAVSDKVTGKTQGQACKNPRRDARQQ